MLPGYYEYAGSILQNCHEKLGKSSGKVMEKKQLILTECQEASILCTVLRPSPSARFMIVKSAP
jgi:hypothetical protein